MEPSNKAFLVGVEIKVLDPKVKVPEYQSMLAAGLDLVANIKQPLELKQGDPAVLIPTGIAISIRQPGIAAFIFPRSGKGHKEGLVMGNGTGVIDADYQGELFISAFNRNPPIMSSYRITQNGTAWETRPGKSVFIKPGERIAQLVFMPVAIASFYLVEEFGVATERGAGGFGSTGAK